LDQNYLVPFSCGGALDAPSACSGVRRRRFTSNAYFNYSIFYREANFYMSKFNGIAAFTKSEFWGDMNFNESIFKGDMLSFLGARFNDPANQENACRKAKMLSEKNGDRALYSYYFYRENGSYKKEKGRS
jgi:hypothetical protein